MSALRTEVSELLIGTRKYFVEHSDCLVALRELPDAIFDSCVTDPPGAISFMGRDWDDDKGGRDKWIAWLTEVMREVLRVLKPGAFAIVWAMPRTSHWTGIALETAGFSVIDCTSHAFGSGFPKSTNVSKEIDNADFRAWLKKHPAEQQFYKKTRARVKELGTGSRRGKRLKARVERLLRAKAGLVRAVVGTYIAGGNAGTSTAEKGGTYSVAAPNSEPVELAITRGATEKSRDWDGWGTALKPAHEFWWFVQKPFKATIAQNVLTYSTGALNIDACRLNAGDQPRNADDPGRWPPNFVLSHSAGCEFLGIRPVSANPTWDTPNRDTQPSSFTGDAVSRVRHGEPSADRRYDESGATDFAALPGARRPKATEMVEDWRCVSDCPVHAIVQQHGVITGAYFPQFQVDPFIYDPKPSTTERDAGLGHMPTLSGGAATSRNDNTAGLDNPRAGAGRRGGRKNAHPTVKKKSLARYFVRLSTRRGGLCLDPFCGSGSHGVACIEEGVRFYGIELNDTDKEPFVRTARARIAHAIGFDENASPVLSQDKKTGLSQMSLFSLLKKP